MGKILYWLPRVTAILFILFLGIFALDSFGPGKTLSEMIIGFLIHLIPNYILAVLLYVSWKNEKIGGILFILLGLFFTIYFNTYRSPINFLIVSIPVLLIGISFLINYQYKHKR